MRIFSDVLDLIFPKSCLVCDSHIEKGVICTSCYSQLLTMTSQVCNICGTHLKDNKCEVCEEETFYFDKAVSIYEYNNILKSLIHNFKYQEFTVISKFFAEEISSKSIFLNELDENFEIIPVPMHSVKKRQRGYNQAEVFAKDLSFYTNMKLNSKLTYRNRFTQTQTKLNKSERHQNLKNAFGFRKKYFNKDKFLVVDDVFTTGSTVNELSKLLIDNGAKEINVLTIARAIK